MNAAKSLLNSALDAAGKPALVTKVFHDAEKNALRVYTAKLEPETNSQLLALRFNFTSISDLDPLLDTPEGVYVQLDNENKKHVGSTVRITRHGFYVAVGKEWRYMTGCNLIGIPLGFGKLHIQFTRVDGRNGSYIKVS